MFVCFFKELCLSNVFYRDNVPINFLRDLIHVLSL